VWRRDTAAFHRALAAAGTPAARHDLLATSSRRRQPATAPNEEGGMNRWMSWSSGAGVAGASTAPRAAFLMPVATNTDVGLTGAANELGHLVTGGGTMALDAARALPIHGPLPRCRA
jgi:hypothetical protein